jgi:putative intracellular protease/amidase
MKTKIASVRKFVDENRTYLAFCAGSVVTTATILTLNHNLTLLRLTKDHAELLKQGGAIVYELKDQTVHLVNLPAVEAAQAAL